MEIMMSNEGNTTQFCADKSVKGREWQLKELPSVPAPDNINPMAAQIAASRGFDPETFFSPRLAKEMPDPSRFKMMDEAVDAFCNAVENGKKIVVYGDYDVDGATSTALVLRWLNRVGHGENTLFYIPDRMNEGYGPNSKAITKLREEEGVEFLLCLDSGTTAHEPLGVAQDLGMEIVIIDHHEPDDRDPPGILVNPKRRDEDRAYEYLCTAGLAFLFLVAVQREMRNRAFFNDDRPEVDLREWLGIAALGTVCDMVPLVGLNRAYVVSGLPKMSLVQGLKSLNIANGDTGFTTTTCGFVFGPCINAAGRIGDTRTGTRLLSYDDASETDKIAQELVETNKTRQDIQKSAMMDAIEKVKGSENNVIVLYDPSWHPGVVGLVASKIKDAVDKPAIIIGQGGSASCRAVDGFDIGTSVIEARNAGILIKGGGHKAAAGLTIDPDRIDDLQAFMNKQAEGFTIPPIEVDVAFECGTLTPDAVEALDSLQPFGMMNPKPRIALVGGWARRVQVMKGVHIKLFLTGPKGETEATLWNAIGTPLGDALAEGQEHWVDLYGTARIDSYGGRRRATLAIEDAMIGVSTQDE